MNTAQRILKNTLSLLVSGIFTQIVGFLVAVYLARALGPEGFGKISFAVAVVAYFLLLADLGVPLFAARETARQPSGVVPLAGTVLSLRLVLALVSFCLLSGTAYLLHPSLPVSLLVVLFGLGIFPSALLLEWAFQGIEKMQYTALARSALIVLYGSLVWAVVRSPEDVYRIPVVHLLASLLAALSLWYLFRRQYPGLRLNFEPSSWIPVLRRALPIGLSAIMIQVFYNLDSIMLGFIQGEEPVGLYNAAYKIILFPILAAGFYHDALFPVVSRYWKTDPEALRSLLGNTHKLMLYLAAPLLVGGTLVSKPLVVALYGAPYEACTDAFRILLWAVFIIYLNFTVSRTLLACGRDARYLAGVSFAAAINIFLNLILIPPLGLNGAALATVLAEVSAFFIMATGFRRVVRLALWRELPKAALSAAVMGTLLYFEMAVLSFNVFVHIGIACLAYWTVLYLLKGITREDVETVWNTLLQRTVS